MPAPPDSKPLDVSLIQPPSVPPPQDDPAAQAELEDFKRAKRALALRDLENDVNARRKYAKHIFNFMVGWMAIVVFFVAANAISIPRARPYVTFQLSDPVLITLIGTTTGTVVGVFLIVAKYLYRSKDNA